MKQAWIAAALLSAMFMGTPGCKSAPEGDNAPPPPELDAGGMESGLESTDAATSADGEQAEQAATEAAEGATEAAEAGATSEAAEAAAGEAAEAAASEATEEGGEAQEASSGLEVRVVAGEGGAIEVRHGDEVVGTIANGQVSEELAAWLKVQAQTEGAQITLLVPVAMSFDDVGMPLMKACFAAGFEPTAVNYKPVTE